jgi:uncharacterized iron-regulated protein
MTWFLRARGRLLLAALLIVVFFSTSAPASAGAPSDPVNLAIGDPARKDRVLNVAVDTLIDTATGAAITPQELVDRLRDTKILLLGENHTGAEYHRVQRQVIEALQRGGRTVTIGLEMFPYTQQAALDRWPDGALSEQQFVEGAGWYQHWGYPWNYYRDIFLFARDHRLRLAALNAPRAVVTAVRKKGFKNLTPEEAAHIPADIDVDSADHLALFKAYFAGDASGSGAMHTSGMSDEAWKGMLSAQATWDATMGLHARQALLASTDPSTIIVVLVGSGHVAYDLGIKRQLARGFDGRVTSLIPIDVEADTHTTAVRASYANFVWCVPKEAFSRYPTLGISAQASAESKSLTVIAVDESSAASGGGVKIGDVLVTFDGQPLASKADVDRLMGGKEWGDVVRLTVRREGQDLALVLPLRRQQP